MRLVNVSAINDSGQLLLDLINDILDLEWTTGRLNAGSLPKTLASCSCESLSPLLGMTSPHRHPRFAMDPIAEQRGRLAELDLCRAD